MNALSPYQPQSVFSGTPLVPPNFGGSFLSQPPTIPPIPSTATPVAQALAFTPPEQNGGVVHALMGQGDNSANQPLDFSNGLLAAFNPSLMKNPVWQALSAHRNTISSFGRSAAHANNFGEFAQNFSDSFGPALRQDRAIMEERKAETGRAAGIENTAKMAEQYGQPEMADWIRQGLVTPQQAYNEIIKTVNEQREQAGKTDQWGFPSTSANSQKMNALTQQGIDEQTALGIVSGRYEIRTNPLTGTTSIVDVANQSISPLNGQTPTVPQSQPTQSGQGASLWDMASDATGFGAAAANSVSNTLGQSPGAIGDMLSYPAPVEAKQEFDLFKRDLIRSLSLNPRFPVAEQQRIESLLPVGAFVAPATLQIALRSLDQELARIEQDMTLSLQNPNTPVQQKQADMETLRGVNAARSRLGIPEGGGVNPAPNSIQWELVE